jgi:hypothetical protein
MLLALFGYAGPCLTPTEVESHKHAAVIAYANLLNLPAPPNLIAQARRNALEEAAQECDKRGAATSADAIRALKGEGDD